MLQSPGVRFMGAEITPTRLDRKPRIGRKLELNSIAECFKTPYWSENRGALGVPKIGKWGHRWRRFSHRCISPSGTSSAFSAKTK
jgi:hypothetical protein